MLLLLFTSSSTTREPGTVGATSFLRDSAGASAAVVHDSTGAAVGLTGTVGAEVIVP